MIDLIDLIDYILYDLKGFGMKFVLYKQNLDEKYFYTKTGLSSLPSLSKFRKVSSGAVLGRDRPKSITGF